MGTKRNRGLLATSQGARLLDQCRRDKKLTLEQIAEKAGVSNDVVERLFRPHNGERTDRSGIERIARVLELEPTEFIDPDEWVPPVKSKKKSGLGEIDWRSVFLARLARQEKQRLLRQAATEQGFELNVFVPLGLEERKQQSRSQKSPQMLGQKPIVKRYEHDEFLQQVIGLGTTGKHIAIVGEPGAGKTTILSKVAQFIRNQGKTYPIYVSLSGLKGKSLSEFLLEEWLPEAFAAVDADCTEVEQKQFEKFLRGGDVWLLLDGVDEMANLSPAKALGAVRSLPSDWQMRVVVTCRSNLWDASLNKGMQGFETYLTQEFRESQVEDFIRDWFMQADCLEYGEKLIGKLREPRRKRIFQLVRNPLRLALLCQVVYRNPDVDLPQTKAGLYEQFINYFYEWKPNITDIDWATSPTLKQALHEALGRLALAGLDSEHRFRLPLSLIQQTMGDELFRLAWELGWLNVVDRDEQTDEPIYTFFHPTFQEYFAAFSINDWDWFLPRLHNSKNPKPMPDCQYKVFDQRYEIVLLFWVGRADLFLSIESKNEFIDKLINFRGDCCHKNFYGGDLYLSLANLLAAKLLLEFPTCIHTEAIRENIIRWGTGQKDNYSLNDTMRIIATKILAEADLARVEDSQYLANFDPIIQFASEPLGFSDENCNEEILCKHLVSEFKKDFSAFLNANPNSRIFWNNEDF
jgi:transcriptional regulator with XRE-family HTH domain/energy-coupling factor transporter ATP-binding protein EcfA2